MMDKIRINMLSQATSVDGQGVGSAYIEQVALVKENDDIFEVEINSRKGNFDIYHIVADGNVSYDRTARTDKNIVPDFCRLVLPVGSADGDALMNPAIFADARRRMHHNGTPVRDGKTLFKRVGRNMKTAQLSSLFAQSEMQPDRDGFANRRFLAIHIILGLA